MNHLTKTIILRTKQSAFGGASQVIGQVIGNSVRDNEFIKSRLPKISNNTYNFINSDYTRIAMLILTGLARTATLGHINPYVSITGVFLIGFVMGALSPERKKAPAPAPAPTSTEQIVTDFCVCLKEDNSVIETETKNAFQKRFETLSADQKINCIESIFNEFTKSKYQKHNTTGELWFFLLSNLANANKIDGDKKISLAVAGNQEKLEFNFKTLQEFLKTFEYNYHELKDNIILQKLYDWQYLEMRKKEKFNQVTKEECQVIIGCNSSYKTEDENNVLNKYKIDDNELLQLKNEYSINKFETKNSRDKEESKSRLLEQAKLQVIDFVSQLTLDKPFMKQLNHGGGHYTGLVIEKKANNDFLISNLNSTKKTVKSKNFTTEKEVQDYLITLIENVDTKHTIEKTIFEEPFSEKFYETFFANGTSFKIASEKLALEEKNPKNFQPFTQGNNTCHQASIMNLFKYYIETYANKS